MSVFFDVFYKKYIYKNLYYIYKNLQLVKNFLFYMTLSISFTIYTRND